MTVVLRISASIFLTIYLVTAPFSAEADIEVPPGTASFGAEHAGAEVTDAEWENDQPPVINGGGLSEISDAWVIWFLEPWRVVPTERAAYILARINNLDDEIVVERSLVHAPIPDDGDDATTESQTVTFDLSPLGDPETPSGFYTLSVYEYPETRFFCQEEEPFECFDLPYTEQDFLDWYHWTYEVDYSTFEGEVPITHGPEGFRNLTFHYVAGSAPDNVIDPVIIIPGILGSEKNSDGEWVIDPILHTYDDLIATLDVNHYTPDVDLFTFPYNWRKSNVETAVLLKEKIDEVKGICGCDKVDLVAHSMGGLVARQYIQSDAYDQDVDQLIFLGTPHLGAPKAYLMWEGGENGPFVDPLATITEIILRHEGYEQGYPHLFNYLRTIPIDSVRELLPTYNYIFYGTELREYPNNYPRNTFLEALNANVDALINSGVEIHNIVGSVNPQETITGIDAIDSTEYLPKWEHGYPKNFYDLLGAHGLLRGSGDQTVPIRSASFVEKNLTITASTHMNIPKSSQPNIYQILTGEQAATVVDDVDLINLKLILIKILSPADLLVVDPNGKKIGKENGVAINQIPGAFYTGFSTETEFITILNPLDGEYKVVTQGTGSGAYTVETNYINEATTTGASFTGTTNSGVVTELTLSVDNGHPEELEIIPPDSTPPVITITSPNAKDHLRSELLSVNVSAADESGVSSLETRLGTTTIPNAHIIDLFFKKLGEYKIVASSTDAIGNATTSSRTFRVIANATSTIADFERAYSLGWVTKAVHDTLAKKVKAIVVIKKTIITIIEKKTKKNFEKLEQVLDKAAAKAILKELDKYRGKGLNEQAYQLLKEDIQWLINN